MVLRKETQNNIEKKPINNSPTHHHIHLLPLQVVAGINPKRRQDGIPRNPAEGFRGSVLVHEQPLVGVSHGGDVVHPLPVRGHRVVVQEVAAEEEEERREGDHRRVPQNVVGHHRADEHHEGVGGQQRHVEHQQEVGELALKPQREPHDGGVDGGLQGQEGEVGDEPGDGVGGGAVGVVGGLADEDVSLLDEGRDRVVGGEEEEADGEDEEAEAVGDALRGVFRVPEHGRHHDPHHRQDQEAGEEQLRRATDCDEVAPHQYPGLRDEGVGELGAEVVVAAAAPASGGVEAAVGYVVVFVDGVVAAVRRWCAL